MVKSVRSYHNFSGGELSPNMRGRSDTEIYLKSLEKCRNFIVTKTGQAKYRTGTRYVDNTKSNNVARLIPFIYNDEQAYVLELTDQRLRVYKDNGRVTAVDIASPWLEAELFELQFAQRADVMYVCHRNHAPRKITRSSHTSWAIATYTRTADPFGSSTNYPRAVAFYEERCFMAGTDSNPEKVWASIAGAFDNFTVGTADDDAFTYTVASDQPNVINWMKGTQNFLVIGTNGGNRRMSGSGQETAITPTSITVKDLDYIGSSKTNPVRYEDMLIYSRDDGQKINALEYSFERDSYKPTDLNRLADHILNANVVDMAYQQGPDIVWAVDNVGNLNGMTLDATEGVFGWHKHDTGTATSKFLSICTIPVPNSQQQLWACVERVIDGSTVRFVEYFEQEPSIPEIDDYFTGTSNQATDLLNFNIALFEAEKRSYFLDSALSYDGSDQSVTMTPSATTGNNITFTAGGSLFVSGDVGRQIWEKDGQGRAEIISYTSGTVVSCNILVDFSSTDALAAGNWYLTASTVSGLSHLEGESVSVLTDGAVHPNKTVASGEITLDYQASFVHVGLSYNGFLKTQSLEGGGAGGVSQTQLKNIYRVGIRFLNSLGTKFGTSLYNTEQLLFRNTNSNMNRPPDYFTGDKVIPINNNWERNKNVYVLQNLPLPCIIQMMVYYMNTSNE